MANTYPEPYRSSPKDTRIDPSTCYNRECVSYTAWKTKEATGKWPRRTGDMNAKNWVNILPANGYKKVSAPKNGGKYVGVYPKGTYGHVCWFEKDSTVSEYNYAVVGGYGTRKVKLSDYVWFQIKSPKPAPKPKPHFTVTAKPYANVRSEPTTKAKVVATLAYGRGQTYIQSVTGQSVNGNKKWFRIAPGRYVSATTTNRK